MNGRFPIPIHRRIGTQLMAEEWEEQIMEFEGKCAEFLFLVVHV